MCIHIYIYIYIYYREVDIRIPYTVYRMRIYRRHIRIPETCRLSAGRGEKMLGCFDIYIYIYIYIIYTYIIYIYIYIMLYHHMLYYITLHYIILLLLSYYTIILVHYIIHDRAGQEKTLGGLWGVIRPPQSLRNQPPESKRPAPRVYVHTVASNSLLNNGATC